MSNFREEMIKQLESKPKLNRKEQAVLDILTARPSRLRDRRIARMEHQAKAELKQLSREGVRVFCVAGAEDHLFDVGFDWTTVSWGDVFLFVLKVIVTLLPLLLLLL